jgi:hypothetical protein
MSYRRGLRLKEAMELARQAHEDFPGLLILLHPQFRHRPLTDHLELDGFALIVAGPHGGKPWFEALQEREYEGLYEQVHRQYARLEDVSAPDDEPADPGGTVHDIFGAPSLS